MRFARHFACFPCHPAGSGAPVTVHAFPISQSILAIVAAIVRHAAIQPLAQFLAGLEEWHPLGLDRDRLSGARVATHAGVAFFDRKTRRNPRSSTRLPSAMALVISSKIVFDDALDIPLEQMRVPHRDFLN